MHLAVSIRLDDGQVVSARGDIDKLDEGYVAAVAAIVARSVTTEALAVLAEGE